MANEWATRRIGDCGKVVTGKTPSTQVAEYFGGQYPFITIPDLDGRRDISTTARSLSQRGADALHTCQLPAGAVLMSCIATIGKCGMTVRPSFTNQQINSVICNSSVSAKYLYYVFTTLAPALEAAGGGGSVYTNVSKSRFGDITVQGPPLKEQQAIACILGALDDKIELNRQMNQTLEATARAIFKSWFMDFDPVRVKASGQSPRGLKAAITAHFPDSFEDSELGEIPKGWRIGTLGDLAKHVVDRIQPSDFTETHPYVPIECIEPRSVCLVSSQPGSNARSSLVRFSKGDILFGAMRPYFHKVCIAPFDGTTRTTAFVLRPFASELAYTAFVVSRDETIDYATAHSEGSTIPYAKWAGSLQDMAVVVPPKAVRRAFHESVWPLIERMRANVLTSTMLAGIRDTLLPKLISGEVQVPDAERIAGRAL